MVEYGLTEIFKKGEIFMKHILSFDIAKGKSVYCFIDELRNTIIGLLRTMTVTLQYFLPTILITVWSLI